MIEMLLAVIAALLGVAVTLLGVGFTVLWGEIKSLRDWRHQVSNTVTTLATRVETVLRLTEGDKAGI